MEELWDLYLGVFAGAVKNVKAQLLEGGGAVGCHSKVATSHEANQFWCTGCSLVQSVGDVSVNISNSWTIRRRIPRLEMHQVGGGQDKSAMGLAKTETSRYNFISPLLV